jgi:hypothetical protein
MSSPLRPNLFIVGAMKAGTSSLHEYLHQHPDIFMARFKEPQYFAPHRTRYGMWGQGYDLPEPGIDWYLRLFAEAGNARYAGESSVSYTARHWVDACEERIWRFNPQARIIYLMRDPVERAISHYWHFVAAGRETLPPLAAVMRHEDYLARSDYAYQIEPYLRRFGHDQVYLLTLEELETDPQGTLSALLDWLGVDPTFHIDTRQKHNVSQPVVMQTRRLARPLVHLMESWRWKRIEPKVPQTVRGLLERLARRPVDRRQVDLEPARRYLRRRLLPRVETLSRLLGRDFPQWTTLYAQTPSPPEAPPALVTYRSSIDCR